VSPLVARPLDRAASATAVALALALVLFSSAAAAQGGMGGMGGGPPGGMGRGGPPGGRPGGAPGARRAPVTFAAAKKIEELNPAHHLLDQARKLRLDSTEMRALETVRLRSIDRSAPLLAEYEQLRPTMRSPTRPSGGAPPRGRGTDDSTAAAPDSSRIGARESMERFAGIIRALRERRAIDVADALDAVRPEHRTAARKLLDKQDKRFARLLPTLPTEEDGPPSRSGRPPRPDRDR